MTIQEIISRNISSLRKENHMTQAELADKLNYTEQAISKWERGLSLPDPVMLYRLAEIFNVPVSFMYEENTYTQLSNADEDSLNKKELRIKLIVILTTVFLVGILTYTSINMVLDEMDMFNTRWWIFVFPLAAIIVFCINYFYGKKKLNTLFISIIIWTITNSVYGFFQQYGAHLVLVFLIATILQILILIFPQITKHFDSLRKKS